MPFGSAITDASASTESGGGTVTCRIADEFNRTTEPHNGSYYTGNGWGVSENLGLQWQGSSVAAWVDGSSGVLQIYNPPYPPHPLSSDWTHVWGQQAFLNWTGDRTPMDITVTCQLSRALAVSDNGPLGNENYWGEYILLWFGDGPPFGDGKFYFAISGNMGAAQIFLWDDDGATAWRSTSGIDMTQPFKVRVTCDGPNLPVIVTMWRASEPESSGISLSVVKPTYSNHGFSIVLETENTAIAPDPHIELHLLSLEVVGLDSCTV